MLTVDKFPLQLGETKVTLETIENQLRVKLSTGVNIHLHQSRRDFIPDVNSDVRGFDNGGISGVAVLAESHISVHTWPERQFAAFDIFMCGDAKPELAVKVLQTHFQPGQFQVKELLRGRIGSHGDI